MVLQTEIKYTFLYFCRNLIQYKFTVLHVYFFIKDPSKLEKFNISEFYHIKHNVKVLDEGNWEEVKIAQTPEFL